MYAWLRRPVPGLRVARGDLLLALALSVATLWLAESQVGDVPAGTREQHVRFPWQIVDSTVPVPPGPQLVAVDDHGQDHLTAALNLAVTLPLAVRRRWPLAAFAGQVAGVFATSSMLTVLSLVALLVGAASMAGAARRPVLALGILTVVSAALGVSFAETTPGIPSSLAPFVLLLPVGLAGITLRAARLRAEAYQQRAEALAREQDQATRAAVATERARIARELHDVVSHHVSVMTIQAGAAAKVLDTNPNLARGAMVAVESSGRETMAELRQLLGVLSPSADEGGATRHVAVLDDGEPLEPQPGLAQIPGLVESVRAAGQPVRVGVPDGLELPVAIGLAAYRVVQEALTNALRYAPGARTSVTVEVDGDALVVEVSNEAPRSPSRDGTGAGTGLVGLAERVRIHGGTLAARPMVGGGFVLRARMPLAKDVAL